MHLVFIAGRVLCVGGLVEYFHNREAFVSSCSADCRMVQDAPFEEIELHSFPNLSLALVLECLQCVYSAQVTHFVQHVPACCWSYYHAWCVQPVSVIYIFQRFFLWFCQHCDLMTCPKQNVCCCCCSEVQ